MKKSYSLTVIILDYLKGEKVIRNIESLLQQKVDFSFKVIVVDNSCNKENANILKTLEKYSNVSLHINKSNLGYTKAHNLVSEEIEGDFVLILNPDISWNQKSSLQNMLEYMKKNSSVGILGPKQINEDGSLELSARKFPHPFIHFFRRTIFWKKLAQSYELRKRKKDCIEEVDWLQSSCILVRKSLWDMIGGFNEKYFLFMADIDICHQAWNHGHTVVYYPHAEVQADGIRCSSGGVFDFFRSWVLRQHVKDAIVYYCSSKK